MPTVPTIDLVAWRTGSAAERAAIAAEVDSALQRVGFLLVAGHGVPDALRDEVRACGSCLLRSLAARSRRRTPCRPAGAAGSRVEPRPTPRRRAPPSPPDLKESYAIGADDPVGDASVDAEWFPPNVCPAEQPGLRPAFEAYTAVMRALADDLLSLLGAALGLAGGHVHRAHKAPDVDVPGQLVPVDGRGRGAAARDSSGSARTPTSGRSRSSTGSRVAVGLQVYSDEAGWEDAPYDSAALTVNIGDLLARWTGDRWRSGRHRVLPPDPSAPQEDLTSLVYFYECDHDAVVSTFAGRAR